MEKKASAERAVREIRRKTRRRFSAEEKIRIVIEGLRPAPPAGCRGWSREPGSAAPWRIYPGIQRGILSRVEIHSPGFLTPIDFPQG